MTLRKIKIIGLMLALIWPLGLLNAAYENIQTPEDAILSKGFAAYMDGRDKVAMHYFEEVIRINPNNTAASKGLDKVKTRLKKQESHKLTDMKKLASAKVKEANELMKTGDMVAALDSLHAAVDAVPGYKSAQKDLKKIRKDMEKTLKKKNFNLTSWAYARGVLAYLDRDWSKAFRIWDERSKSDPSNVYLTNARERAEQNFVKMMMSEREEFLRRGAREFYRQGLYHESKKSWARVLETRDDDSEAMEGFARAEQALLDLKGTSADKKMNELLEQGLDFYANQDYRKAKETFQKLSALDPDLLSAKEYINKINIKLSAQQYTPVYNAKVQKGWKDNKPSNQGESVVEVPTTMENLQDRKLALESQLKRDPSNIQVQQELDKIKNTQNEESERIYKDGLIAYSQGNRTMAIGKWKQVLVMNPDHKKASAALRKARAEEERTEASR